MTPECSGNAVGYAHSPAQRASPSPGGSIAQRPEGAATAAPPQAVTRLRKGKAALSCPCLPWPPAFVRITPPLRGSRQDEGASPMSRRWGEQLKRLPRPIAQENRKGRGAAYPHRGSRRLAAWLPRLPLKVGVMGRMRRGQESTPHGGVGIFSPRLRNRLAPPRGRLCRCGRGRENRAASRLFRARQRAGPPAAWASPARSTGREKLLCGRLVRRLNQSILTG